MLGRSLWLSAGAALCSLSACAPHPAAPSARDSYNYDLPFKELMEHVVTPSAFGVWRAVGTRATLKGVQDIAPRTDAAWVEVENSAATVTEAGNLLLLPGRVRAPESAWRAYVQRLVQAGQHAKAAAEAKNAEQLFAAGTELELACSACHAQFMPGGEGGPPPAPKP